MREKAKGIDPLAIEMNGDNQAEFIAANVEDVDRVAAFDLHRIDVWKGPRHRNRILPSRRFHDRDPNVKALDSTGMIFRSRFEKRFFDD